MDVFVETKRGPPFSIEVGYYDTVLNIKEKIHKYQGIPVPAQTLFFNGHILHDDHHDVERCGILQDSRIFLHVSPDAAAAAESDHRSNTTPHHHHPAPAPSPSPAPTPLPPPTPPPPPATSKILIKIKTPRTASHHLSLEMDPNDTVLALKEKIQEIESVHVSRLVLQSNGGGGPELQDHRTLRDCDITNNSEISATARPPIPAPSPPPAISAATTASVPTGSGSSGSNKKLKLLVVTKCATKKLPVEVNAGDNVSELRKELQRLHQKMNFPLPQEGYFFIYKQNVMEDEQSFRWHQCGQGDTIEIFNGSVTGGS
ncbi:unnamed protein product [Linum tenue]|uniref:Ubiquitin-like domain-containing protein n=2 Tax=Linum tenue TaxID=586396 RepID=A0AAV0PCW7_9ROSI|nr:unnamed protein product [Linum tenue]